VCVCLIGVSASSKGRQRVGSEGVTATFSHNANSLLEID
jgi:hypothetical protein